MIFIAFRWHMMAVDFAAKPTLKFSGLWPLVVTNSCKWLQEKHISQGKILWECSVTLIGI